MLLKQSDILQNCFGFFVISDPILGIWIKIRGGRLSKDTKKAWTETGLTKFVFVILHFEKYQVKWYIDSSQVY